MSRTLVGGPRGTRRSRSARPRTALDITGGDDLLDVHRKGLAQARTDHSLSEFHRPVNRAPTPSEDPPPCFARSVRRARRHLRQAEWGSRGGGSY